MSKEISILIPYDSGIAICGAPFLIFKLFSIFNSLHYVTHCVLHPKETLDNKRKKKERIAQLKKQGKNPDNSYFINFPETTTLIDVLNQLNSLENLKGIKEQAKDIEECLFFFDQEKQLKDVDSAKITEAIKSFQIRNW